MSEANSDIGGPLLGGLCVVLAAGIAPMLMPRLITGRSLALMENVSLYGGLAVFGGLTLYDVCILCHLPYISSIHSRQVLTCDTDSKDSSPC